MLLSLDVPSVSRNYNSQTPYELAMNNGFTKCAEAIGNKLDMLL